MSEGSVAGETSDAKGPSFRLLYLFHPSFHVMGLDEAEKFYQKVFGLSSTRMSTGPQDPDNRWDYCTFTMIRDLFMDSIDPELFIKEGKQEYPSIDEPHLMGFGWYVDNTSELYRALRQSGIEVKGLLGERGGDDEPPTSVLRRSSDTEMVGRSSQQGDENESAPTSTPMFFTVPDDIGLRYQFITPMQMPQDPRMKEGWELGPRRDDDPLGIDFTSHHTILTARPERVLKLMVDVLGGRVIHEGRNDARGTASTYVRLADGTQEIAVPDAGTAAHADLATTLPRDCYHAITFKVADLDKTRRHLEAEGISLRVDVGSMIVTDPKTSMGVPWGFASEAVPGDDRA